MLTFDHSVPVSFCSDLLLSFTFFYICQVEVEEGAESVLLPFKTTENLPGNARVKWRDRYNRRVHVYKNPLDQLEEQHQDYRDRTKMNEDPLKTGVLSLTLDQPTERNSGRYNCVAENTSIFRYKTVVLKVKGRCVSVCVCQCVCQTGSMRNRNGSKDLSSPCWNDLSSMFSLGWCCPPL
uniref:Ig-like domain-containing protein n=1 Tax=Amphilophus citrinellus TaxID=61819 RepID=A0A3Q0RVV2_AMPCI